MVPVPENSYSSATKSKVQARNCNRGGELVPIMAYEELQLTPLENSHRHEHHISIHCSIAKKQMVGSKEQDHQCANI